MNQLPPIFQQALKPFMPPRFTETYCSQCGQTFGPGNHGYSHCSEHKNASWHKANDMAALACQIKTQGDTT